MTRSSLIEFYLDLHNISHRILWDTLYSRESYPSSSKLFSRILGIEKQEAHGKLIALDGVYINLYNMQLKTQDSGET